ncbi:receptor-like protein 56 [Impatiens glandulifera]|uniref:receptor-like protein 56 n=1 Tax=Impatiens glandulifera TaxID=253017 RepID=UPI001FB17062|nr:receptor-like protein 56 [Impatiens glandulifera]
MINSDTTTLCTQRPPWRRRDTLLVTPHCGSHCGYHGGGNSSFYNMIKLKNLDLSGNNLEKDVLVTLGALSSLQFLNLSKNPSIQGSFTNEDLIGFHHLEILNLDHCGLNGTIPPQNLCKMKKLKELDLFNNYLEGDIPTRLNELSFLRRLDVNNNLLNGSISLSLFKDLNSLEYINLRDNNLEGSLSLSTFANLSKLQNVLINSKSDKLVIEEDEVDWVPKFQLKTLILSNCSLKLLPKFLLFQKNLFAIDLSHNRLGDSFPNWLAANNTMLHYLYMQDNNLSGSLHMSKNSLIALDVSRNNLSGFFNFSWSIGRGDMDFIDISHNKMSGHIPRSSISITIRMLAMRNNSFSGPFPCEYVADTLDISYNSFTGAFFSCPGVKYYWSYLNLYGNKFTGIVPETVFSSLLSLNTLDIGENSFSGKIPNFIKHESDIRVLSLRGNDFTGEIPHQLCQLRKLNWLDLSNNFLSGPIPSCLGDMNFGKDPNYAGITYIAPTSVEGELEGMQSYVYDDNVEMYTKYRADSYTGRLLAMMSGLDLSCNNLEGEIPNELGYLNSIHTLNLSHNWLSGSIPQTFSNLKQIESLDLSQNNLSGEIPSNLIDLNFMGTFSVAYNNLSGRLPDMKGQFQTFKENSYAGNPFLCGPPLKKDCKVKNKNNNDDHHDHDDDKDEAWYTIDREVFFASFMGAYIVYILGFITVLWINTRWRNMWFNFIENILFSSYYFLLDAWYKCFRV